MTQRPSFQVMLPKLRPDLKIYIASHKDGSFPNLSHFQPIQGGAAINPPLSFIGDNTGDNISAENPFYAEITPMYWVWKNERLPKYVGFFHYRRFLNFGELYDENLHWMDRKFMDFSMETIEKFGWSLDHIMNKIKSVDIVIPNVETVLLPPHWQEATSLYNHYDASHHIRDLELSIDAIKRLYPEQAALCEEVMARETGYFCHMYIMRSSIFKEYMAWLFSIFEDINPKVDLTSPIYRKEYGNQRIHGFLGERLFNVFIEIQRRKGKKIMEVQRLFGQFPN